MKYHSQRIALEDNRLAATALTRLIAEYDHLASWMHDKAFPLWATAGIHESGVTFEALDFDGQPVLSDAVRVRVIARQIFVFSLAYERGWQPELCREIVRYNFDALTGRCRRADGLLGKVFDLSSTSLADDTFCLYDTAFALLAMASATPVLGSGITTQAIDEVLAAMEREVAREEGGYIEEAVSAPTRLQNPHMHLFESLLAIGENGNNAAASAMRARLLPFIQETFFDNELAIVHERRGGDHPLLFEPGHSFEWVWLLWWAGESVGADESFAARLYERAFGALTDDQVASLEVALDESEADASCRSWSQAEMLKAHLCRALSTDGEAREVYLQRACRTARMMHDLWLAPAVDGGWHDHLSPERRLLSPNMPASSGYHLFGAIDFLGRAIGRLTA